MVVAKTLSSRWIQGACGSQGESAEFDRTGVVECLPAGLSQTFRLSGRAARCRNDPGWR